MENYHDHLFEQVFSMSIFCARLKIPGFQIYHSYNSNGPYGMIAAVSLDLY